VHTLDGPDKAIDYSRAVLTAFVKLYHQRDPHTGQPYIYRGKRMVNWCPASLTALSDEEVVMKDQHGKMYYMRYEVVERPGEYVRIATTRPETLMGDTAVAINPDDEKYRHLHGLHVWRPFPRAQIPIILGRRGGQGLWHGSAEITPAHDRADFEIGQRHQLPIIDVLNPDGTLNELAGEEFQGNGPLQGAQGGNGETAGTAVARRREALREQGRLFGAGGRADRAAVVRAVVSALPAH